MVGLQKLEYNFCRGSARMGQVLGLGLYAHSPSGQAISLFVITLFNSMVFLHPSLYLSVYNGLVELTWKT